MNVVVLNAILQSEDSQRKTSFGWDDYKRVLFEMNNRDVFDDTPKGMRDVFTHNIPHGYILDTKPLRTKIEAILDDVGYDTLGSLYLPSYISVVEYDTGIEHRLFSRSADPAVRNLRLVDILMATTAIPMVFPPRRVLGYAGDILFIDGGAGRDTIPVEALTEERCRSIYVVTHSLGTWVEEKRNVLPKPIQDIEILANLLKTREFLAQDLFDLELDRAKQLARRAFLYRPKLKTVFPLLDFSKQREQYQETMEWALKNEPVLL